MYFQQTNKFSKNYGFNFYWNLTATSQFAKAGFSIKTIWFLSIASKHSESLRFEGKLGLYYTHGGRAK